MKMNYSSPEIELIRLSITADVLNVSDPDPGVTTGSGSGQGDPGVDPFGDLGNP